jgi:hypothetical protein
MAKLTTAFENAHLGGSIQEIGSPRQDQIALVTLARRGVLRTRVCEMIDCGFACAS